jgi:outer membrane receptor protein involved in Fe transport
VIRHFRRARDLRCLPAIAILSLAGGATAQEAATPSEALVLPQLAVEGAHASARGPVEGYVAPTSATGTKIDTPLLETPQSVSVITRDKNWRLQLNATNLGDEYYVQACSGGAHCAYGTGRSIYATLAYRW